MGEGQGWVTVTGAELWAWRQRALRAALAAGVEAEEVDWLLGAMADAMADAAGKDGPAAIAPLDRLSLRLGTVQHRA
ncbi:MAG TPA: hypothetical protein VLS96_08170, partial [Nodosilinea sp.]|nr:hypothetical protein [Nodosilinea sp.]